MSPLLQGPRFSRHHHREGMALVVALLMLVLITATVLAFFSQSMMNRTISFSSAGQARANQIALSGLDYVKGDLLEEIQSGSTLKVDNASGIVIYQPLSNTNMTPFRMTTNVAYDAAMPPNLVKWSSATYPQWPSTGYNQAGPTRAPASTSTTNAATSGRYISTARWTKPQFLASSTFPANAVPDWVLMTRQGPLTNTATAAAMLSTLADSTPGNGNYVIGRYAYTVYDVGGLVDVTAAGYSPTTFPASDPSGIAPTYVGRKGSQGFADLTQLGLTSAQADQIVNWRNATTGATTNSYIAYLSTNAPATGFLQVASGDRTFLGRQDFMQYWNSEVGGSTNIPPYFTTFSREKNAPSWGPTHNASYWSGTNSATDPSTGATISYAYADDRDAATSSTRFFPNVRVQTAFTRLSGEAAVAGEPLVKTRFDLSKLSWITYNNSPPAGVSSTDIYHYFGLTRNSDGSWTYNHTTVTPPSGAVSQTGSIMTLDQVAAAGREPDFFELLQAALLRGGIGLCSGDYTQALNDTSSGSGGEFYRLSMGASASFTYEAPLVRSDADNHLVYAMEKYQIIQIGANIIDQYDSDNFPTEIVLNSEHFYGVENLPYINAMADSILRPAPGAVQSPKDATFNDPAQQYVHRWLTAALWNPHQNAAHPPSVGPAHLRIAVTGGELYPVVHNLSGFPTAGYYMGRKFEPAGTSITTNAGINIDGPAWVAFKLSDYAGAFAEPTMLNYSTAYTSDGNNPVSGNMNDGYGLIATQLGWQRAGIYLGWSKSPDNPYKVPLCASVFPQYLTKASPGILYDAAGYTYSSPLKVELQYEDTTTAGTWHTYEVLRGFIHSRGSPAGDAYMEPNDPAWNSWSVVPPATAPYNNTTGLTVKQIVGTSAGPLAANQEAAVLNFNDPRTVRYNIQTINVGGPNQLTANFGTTTTGSPAILPGADVGPHFPRAGVSKNSRDYPVNWINNNATTLASYYTDRDYVMRRGDAAGWSGASPFASGAATQRPIHLDRPFQSVAELGYVFRDDVWRTLNLFSDRSPDTGLLDVFCIGYGSTNSITQPAPSLVAGKMNINSAIQDTLVARRTSSLPLQSLISQALRDYSSSNPSVINSGITSSADIQTLATSLVSYGQTNGPLMNVADLASVFPQDTSTNSANPGLKWPREAMVRALADSTSTRTWNLMIDIIAQSGKYNRLSGNLNAFTVEGEKHYWLHVAIDRFTGEVIDQQLEPVWD